VKSKIEQLSVKFSKQYDMDFPCSRCAVGLLGDLKIFALVTKKKSSKMLYFMMEMKMKSKYHLT